MVDRLELAKQYVQEMLEKRDDIVGAFVVGSVAKGTADETSDVDLALLVEGNEGGELQYGGIDQWRGGVYIDAFLLSAGRYGDAQKVLHSWSAAVFICDALIVHDPTGLYTRVQTEVREAFMEPRWLGARVHPTIYETREGLDRLRAAVSAKNLLGICQHARGISGQLVRIPLLIEGITPSSTRGMLQLDGVAPELKSRICEWQGSKALDADDVRALLPVIPECISTARGGFAPFGDWTKHFVEMVEWLADNRHHREALDQIWDFVRFLARFALASDDIQVASDAEKLVQKWLRSVGWEGQDVLEEKVRQAEEMVAEVEAMAAHLPLDEV